MHCPNCRNENPATTRFCTACGAVLVESTRDGARRRVLRPWGLRNAAPLTESPAMPEMAALQAASRRRRPRTRGAGIDLMFAGGIVLVLIAGAVAYPYVPLMDGVPEEPGPMAGAPVGATAEELRPLPPIEAKLFAPPLLEPAAGRAPSPAVPAKPASRAGAVPDAIAQSAARREHRMAEALAAPVREPIVNDVERNDPPAPHVNPNTLQDPMRPLRDALASCGARSGMIERAMCEQGARLAHCEGQWGFVDLCPGGRTD